MGMYQVTCGCCFLHKHSCLYSTTLSTCRLLCSCNMIMKHVVRRVDICCDFMQDTSYWRQPTWIQIQLPRHVHESPLFLATDSNFIWTTYMYMYMVQCTCRTIASGVQLLAESQIDFFLSILVQLSAKSQIDIFLSLLKLPYMKVFCSTSLILYAALK